MDCRLPRAVKVDKAYFEKQRAPSSSGLSVVGETGFEPATARHPDSPGALCWVSIPAGMREPYRGVRLGEAQIGPRIGPRGTTGARCWGAALGPGSTGVMVSPSPLHHRPGGRR